MTALALCTLLSGCEKEEAVDANAQRVEVVLSPGGVGDQGYNDKILRGLQLAAAQYGFTLAFHIPKEKRQAEDIYEAGATASPARDVNARSSYSRAASTSICWIRCPCPRTSGRTC